MGQRLSEPPAKTRSQQDPEPEKKLQTNTQFERDPNTETSLHTNTEFEQAPDTEKNLHTKSQFEQELEKRILILDGAMGTMIQQKNLSAADFGDEAYEGCNEYLVLTAPDVIASIHEAYLEAGADIIETDTFGATSIVLDEYGLGNLAEKINTEAACLAKQAAEKYSTPARPRFVAGSMGPTTKTLSVTGGTTFAALKTAYQEQARGLIKGGADALLVETSQDLLNVKAAFLGITDAFAETEKNCRSSSPGPLSRWARRLPAKTLKRSTSRLRICTRSQSASTVQPGPNLCPTRSARSQALRKPPSAVTRMPAFPMKKAITTKHRSRSQPK